MQITIIGGQGELGLEITKACKKAGHIITTTSRKPQENQIQFDWNNKQSYQNLHSSKIIINAAPVKDLNNYFEFIDTLLSNNQKFIETSARPDLVVALIDFQKNFKKNTSGLIVHAVGIFPGISNFLLKEALEQKPNAKSVNFNVKYSIFSKAGKDMCQLMAESLARPSVFVENGNLKFDKPVGPIKTFEKINNKGNSSKNTTWKGFLADLPDTRYFTKQLPEAKFIGSYFSPVSDFLFPFLNLFNFAPKNPFFINIYAKCFYFIRGIIFKNKTSKMLITIVLDDVFTKQIEVQDALYTAGAGVAAILPFLENQKGILRADEFISSEAFFNTINQTEPNILSRNF
ncbi:hypothetical protein EGI22_00735 [Lacihabitans sp. LS3-19]|uniref:hypothetical protein n=1 Tax=Lacihabitans sp. LS3-19 TaxID=2487335 RepID=UPI0020CF123C|nr:hypothetical protein [Lacihabitans sp. LS3-19]MCP9766411.1 hypothetical protein [Lacihabitans sp. LS3-19]